MAFYKVNKVNFASPVFCINWINYSFIHL